MANRTAGIATSTDRRVQARASWNAARSVRRKLKDHLTGMCARPAFCMYCHESRGTDVDHFVPIVRDPMLTFEWRNHILACGFCNQQAKNEVFPVDPSGHPLLLDPDTDDSGDHMTLSTSGEFIDLTARGATTIDVLRLNDRTELVDARFRSWRWILRIFDDAVDRGAGITEDDLEDLRFLPIVDAFHHFAHDVATGRLTRKAVKPSTARFAAANIAVLRRVFPDCRL
jgi:uncharacterized protein (TIGR02646 family)